ncbi:hypothetical protein GIB67_035203 [Kingdonia uniflora]|uniref:Uncharacterized protein n=1 Tax=Kingdonia uniflora TaxID=39325 RepID=A0A7J7KXU9_9MAGN|nr:hypothetical protein GIB67_035203 [Kingdonia uniflora]
MDEKSRPGGVPATPLNKAKDIANAWEAMSSIPPPPFKFYCNSYFKSADSESDIKELIYEEKDLTKVVENFKKLSKSKFIHFRHGGRNNTYELTIRRLASAKQFSAIEEILEEQKKYNNILKEGFAIRIISLYGKAGMVDHAFKTLEQIPELKCDRTIKYVNALLSAYVDSKKYDGSRALIS